MNIGFIVPNATPYKRTRYLEVFFKDFFSSIFFIAFMNEYCYLAPKVN